MTLISCDISLLLLLWLVHAFAWTLEQLLDSVVSSVYCSVFGWFMHWRGLVSCCLFVTIRLLADFCLMTPVGLAHALAWTFELLLFSAVLISLVQCIVSFCAISFGWVMHRH